MGRGGGERVWEAGALDFNRQVFCPQHCKEITEPHRDPLRAYRPAPMLCNKFLLKMGFHPFLSTLLLP